MIIETKDNKTIITLETLREETLLRVSLIGSVFHGDTMLDTQLEQHKEPKLSAEEAPLNEILYNRLCHLVMEQDRTGKKKDSKMVIKDNIEYTYTIEGSDTPTTFLFTTKKPKQ